MSESGVAQNESRTTFFRQSGWMMVASTMGGACMFAVHLLNQKIPPSEYAVLGALLSLTLCLQVPTIGVQTTFAQQSAAAISESDRRKLAGTVRAVLRYSLFTWLAFAVLALVFEKSILSALKIANPMGLWVTLVLALVMLWTPVFQGVLQGQQNFFWIGWASMLNGIGRVGVAALFVLAWKSYAAGIMFGALCGALPPLLICAWHSRSIWMMKGQAPDWQPWLRRVVPFSLGLATTQFMLSSDVIMVQTFFNAAQTPDYIPIATVGRALVLFTAPLAVIMFPKIVRNMALAKTSDVLKLTLFSTAILGVCAAGGLMLLAVPVFKVVFPKYVAIAPMTATYAWSILPQALAGVLINNLMARERYQVVPWLIVATAGYLTALTVYHDSFPMVLRVLGIFSLIYFAISAFFAWRAK